MSLHRLALLIGTTIAFLACGSSGGTDAPDTAAPPVDAVVDVAPPEDAPGPPDVGEDVPLPDDAGGTPDVPSDVGPRLPDRAFFHVARAVAPVSDVPTEEELPTLYRTTDALPDLHVTALAWSADTVWAGTPSGVYRYDAAADRFVAAPLPAGATGAVVDLAAHGPDGLVVALADAVVVAPRAEALDEGTLAARTGVTAVASDGSAVFAAGAEGVASLAVATGEWTVVAAELAARDLALVPGADGPFVATDAGVVRLDGPQPVRLTAADGLIADDDVRALAVTEHGVLAATATGLARIATEGDGVTPEVIRAERGGLPTDALTAVDARGSLWAMGHAVGATVRTPDGLRSDHYHSLRWIADERVTAVALAPDGTRWIGTAAGVSRIALVPRTLAEKATWMEAFLEEHFWRMDGFVASDVVSTDDWAMVDPYKYDKDNDGLWTQMQVGAWAMASAATGDPAYCAKARRAMQTMFLEVDVPALSFEAIGRNRGFVTRSLVRDDEGALFTEKATRPNWHLVHYGDHDYYWKDDTSSDETTGHFFGYPLYYDLCAADDAERAAVADHAGALAMHILESGYRLLDLDGLQTTHGEWQPEALAIAVDGLAHCALELHYPPEDCAAAFGGHGWLNGIQILGHFLSAWHMTGDPTFYEAYQRLLDEYRYAELVDFHDTILTVTNPAIANHSDHELAILAYFTLIRYEPDDARRARWIASLLAAYEWELPESNPLWAMVVASAVPEGADLGPAIRTLHEIPTDLRTVRYDNSHRKDARVVGTDRHGDPQFDRVFPYDELRSFWWNGNPYGVADGGNPREYQCPMFWLLPYWGLRYAGAIAD